jgi:hypothetical protein
MFCGFGAVVLLVLVINSNTVSTRNQTHEDLRGEVMRLEREVLAGEQYLAELANSLKQSDDEITSAKGRSRQIITIIQDTEEELATLQNQTLAEKEHINGLASDLKTLDTEHKRLGAEIQAEQAEGDKIVSFTGQDNRQYLTGLKLDGKHILILVDSSASMLADSIVNIIRRRNLDDTKKIMSDKWQHTVKTAHWLVANLPKQALFQLYTFNTSSKPVLTETADNWIQTTDTETVLKMIEALKHTIPDKGTSLVNTFAMISRLSPRPDNIILLTDGLPTQGSDKPRKNRVSGEQRVKLFQEAIPKLPGRIPVNIILFPMEGDPMAASLFWKLAIDTQGSFLTPSKDWP